MDIEEGRQVTSPICVIEGSVPPMYGVCAVGQTPPVTPIPLWDTPLDPVVTDKAEHCPAGSVHDAVSPGCIRIEDVHGHPVIITTPTTALATAVPAVVEHAVTPVVGVARPIHHAVTALPTTGSGPMLLAPALVLVLAGATLKRITRRVAPLNP